MYRVALCFGQSVLPVGNILLYRAFNLLTSNGLDFTFLGAGSPVVKWLPAECTIKIVNVQ